MHQSSENAADHKNQPGYRTSDATTTHVPRPRSDSDHQHKHPPAGEPAGQPRTPRSHRVDGRPRRRRYHELTYVGRQYARAYCQRPTADQFVTPAVDPARLPPWTRPVRDVAEARQLLASWEAIVPWGGYANARRTRQAIWRALCDYWDPQTGLATVGHARLAERASIHAGARIARATAGDHCRALESSGALHVPAGGRGATAEATGGTRDRATSYVLLAPDEPEPADDTKQLPEDKSGSAVDEFRHLPKGSARPRTGDIYPPRKQRHFPSSDVGKHPPPSTVLGRSRKRGAQRRAQPPEKINPETSQEKLHARMWLAARLGHPNWRFALIDKELVLITSPLFAAGWSAEAAYWCLVRQPDGTPYPGPDPIPSQQDHPSPPRPDNLWALLTWRRDHWRDPMGCFLDPPVPAWKPKRGRPAKGSIRADQIEPAAAIRPATQPPSEARAAINTQLAAIAARRALQDEHRQARSSALHDLPGPRWPEPDQPHTPSEPLPPLRTPHQRRSAHLLAKARLRAAAERRGATTASRNTPLP